MHTQTKLAAHAQELTHQPRHQQKGLLCAFFEILTTAFETVGGVEISRYYARSAPARSRASLHAP